MRIVDFHTHFFSRPFFDALAMLSPHPGEPGARLARVAQEADFDVPPADTRRHLARWIEELDAKGVEHAVTFASVPEEISAVEEAVRISEGRLTGCAVMNPWTPGADEDLWSLLTEERFRGVVLFPAIDHFFLGEERHERILRILDDRSAVVFVHSGILRMTLRDLFGLPRNYHLRYANPLGVVPAANRAPRASFVVPHFGAGFFRETLMAGEMCDNVYVDTSSSNRWIRTQAVPTTLREVFARALDVFGPERILFGTDSGIFPRGWREDRLAEQRGVLDDLGVDASEQERIFSGNALRLLRSPS